MPEMMNADSQRGVGHQILGLDVVRFLAAALVAMLHFQYCPFGWVGVEVFFVLSGFVIAYSAKDECPARFFVSRFVRLAPAAWICATLTLAIWWAEGNLSHDVFVSYIHSVAFLPNPPWIVIVYWSLHVEIMFYAIVFILLVFSARFEVIVPVMIAVGTWSTTGDVFPGLYDSLPAWLKQVTLTQYGCFFAIGVLLWACTRQRYTWTRVGFLALFIVGGIFEIKNNPNAAALEAAVCFSVLLVLMFVAVLCDSRMPSTISTLALQIRVVGLMTYPLYLIHYPLRDFAYWYFPDVRRGGWDPLVAAATLLVSLFITLVMEPPLKRRLKRGLELLIGLIGRLAPVRSVGAGRS
jgi:peptidoglycan/LPS O-acetylase OafA/YrhL